MTVRGAPEGTATADGQIFVVTTAVLVLLAVIRFLICWIGPEALQPILETDFYAKIGLLSLILLIPAIYFIVARNEIRLGLIAAFFGFLLTSHVLSFQVQYLIFYLGRHFELVDARLGYLDEMMGFDWAGYFHWMVSHPWIMAVLEFAYLSIWWQPLILAVIFLMLPSCRKFCELQIALPLSFIVTCAIATILPALGPYQLYGMTPDQHSGFVLGFTNGMTAPIMWLRAADFSNAMPSFPDLRVITFPSWHSAAAIIFIGSAWRLKGIRWVALALNTLMLLATPIQGSHYLTDVLIGALIGAASLKASIELLKHVFVWRQVDQPADSAWVLTAKTLCTSPLQRSSIDHPSADR